MVIHRPAPNIQRQRLKGDGFALRPSDDVQIGRHVVKGRPPVQRSGVVQVMIARQDYRRYFRTTHLADEEIQQIVRYAGVVKHVAGYQQGVSGEGAHTIYHRRQGALGGSGIPTVAQVSVRRVDQPDFPPTIQRRALDDGPVASGH